MSLTKRRNTDDWMANIDPDTDVRLLPPALRRSGNQRRIRHYRIALCQAIDSCLTPVQKRNIRLFYWRGLSKTEIARKQALSCSAVTKSIQSAEERIKAYVGMYMCIYDALEKEFLADDQ